MFIKPACQISIFFLVLLSCSFLTPYEGEVELLVTGRNDTNGIVIECTLINNSKNIVEAPYFNFSGNSLICQKPDSTFQNFVWIMISGPEPTVIIQQSGTMIWEYNLTEEYIKNKELIFDPFPKLFDLMGEYKIFWQVNDTKSTSFVIVEKKKDETLVLIEQQENY